MSRYHSNQEKDAHIYLFKLAERYRAKIKSKTFMSIEEAQKGRQQQQQTNGKRCFHPTDSTNHREALGKAFDLLGKTPSSDDGYNDALIALVSMGKFSHLNDKKVRFVIFFCRGPIDY